MKASLILAAMAATVAMASPAHAVTALKLEITNANLAANPEWLQVTEIQAFTAGGMNVALASAGASVAAGTAGLWPGAGAASVVIDGIINGNFGSGNLYHSSAPSPVGQSLTVTFAALSDITQINVFGRTDCCQTRDAYNYRLFDASGAVVDSGFVGQAVSSLASVTLPSAVPEPSTWALMISGLAVMGASLRRRRRASHGGRLALA